MSHESRNTRHQTRLVPHHCLTPRRAAGRRRKNSPQAAAARATHHETQVAHYCPLLPGSPVAANQVRESRPFPAANRSRTRRASRNTRHESPDAALPTIAHYCPLLPAIAGSPVAANQVSAHSHPFSVGLGCRKTKNRHPRRACRQVTDSPLTTAHYCLLLLTTACYCPPLPGKKFPQIECPRTVIHSRAVSVTKSAKNALAHSVGLAGFLWSFGSVAGSPGQSLHGYGIARMLC